MFGVGKTAENTHSAEKSRTARRVSGSPLKWVQKQCTRAMLDVSGAFQPKKELLKSTEKRLFELQDATSVSFREASLAVAEMGADACVGKKIPPGKSSGRRVQRGAQRRRGGAGASRRGASGRRSPSQARRRVRPNLRGRVEIPRETRFSIANKKVFKTFEGVSEALSDAGVESSNLIIGVDFTKSNLKKGNRSFRPGKDRRGLHTLREDGENPYQSVIGIVGRSLEHLDDDKLIPCYGFGSIETKAHSVFPFLPEAGSNRYCHGFGEVLDVYGRVAPRVVLSGPTSFAPLIRRALEVVKRGASAEYHILVIIADGQVDVEWETIDAIREASLWPLSIVMVGVGDGPWDQMVEFDDKIKGRAFDNFNFVNYAQTMKMARSLGQDSRFYFATQALQEVPPQYSAMKALGLIGKKTGAQHHTLADCYLLDESRPELMPVRDLGLIRSGLGVEPSPTSARAPRAAAAVLGELDPDYGVPPPAAFDDQIPQMYNPHLHELRPRDHHAPVGGHHHDHHGPPM